MTYYTTDENGRITAFADQPFAETALATDREIVRGRDGGLYFAGEEPQPTPEEEAAEAAAARRAEIQAELAAIDLASVRPLRAITEGTATDYDRNRLAELEARAAQLRAELREMENDYA
ncbi:hypothetical protein FACS189460_3070 [Deltaproteobacteria bacterium]|nr:hypothetical protein FACS189460_3070 [Deltaproteobacteria bacterium]